MSSDPRTPVIVAARRTPIATVDRGLARCDAAALAAAVLAALAGDLAAAGMTTVDDVVLGNCRGPGGDVARVAALAAGLGVEVPGVTVDRQCGSGLEAVRLAALAVAAGAADVVLAGGVESASSGPRTRARFTPPGMPDPEMGEAAEVLASHHRVSRERQDAYAVRSHARALRAAASGWFDAELVPGFGPVDDDRPRPLTAELLARFRPAFVPGGSVTAGNSCGVSDGAAGVAVVTEELRGRAGLPGLRVLGSAVVGVDPSTPGIGPVPAIRAALRSVRHTVDDLALIEITEAFAAQLLACTDALGLDPMGADADRVCPDGGAIALGHPWGASGALLVVRAFARLVRHPDAVPRPPGGAGQAGRAGQAGQAGRAGQAGQAGQAGRSAGLAVAACPIGGGQGIALVLQRVG